MDQALEVLVAVIEKKNFTRAAEELSMTQPAVSQYIRSLEQSLGAKLLERSNKYVRPTHAGDIVYHHAKSILGTYTAMQSLVDDVMNRAGGELAIGASYTFGEYVLPRLLARLKQQYPLVRPSIHIGNTDVIGEMVLNYEIDIGIVEGEYEHAKLLVSPFAQDELQLVVPNEPRFQGRRELELQELLQETWILRESGSGTRRAAERMFEARGQRPPYTLEFGSTQLIKESVEAGLGISLLSRWAVQKELQLGSLLLVPLRGEAVVRPFSWILHHTPYRTKAVDVFLDMLKSPLQG
ncbi:LysR family transcriptional regulator [Paenibacillus sp. F411]|uniref:Transcriptional regulator, LysR family n=1 Tax=Paenibacillus algicola TaxID=2565926 RepID=A0A4P8XS56_9BACL|nr:MULTISPECIES: LysR family transcriptional regulator [Paenibacillus]MBO2944654.1 LysR family transcriptional regulator [Paenibacillus sp. F411]QCT04711.1 transcriptional regulator, LysR family [Paenibacillus algicola]